MNTSYIKITENYFDRLVDHHDVYWKIDVTRRADGLVTELRYHIFTDVKGVPVYQATHVIMPSEIASLTQRRAERWLAVIPED